MCKNWMVLGALGVAGFAGCASWREAAPSLPVAPAAANSASATTVVVKPSTSIPIAVNSPSNSASSAAIPATAAQQKNAVQQASLQASAEDVETPGKDDLTLAAEYLERGDKPAAAYHLELYVRKHPDQIMFRLQLAELLLQTQQDARARVHFEKFEIAGQEGNESVKQYLVHIHTRLMEIAQRQHDEFGELFHRGVGLLLLVEQQDKSPDRDAMFCEEMVCKALRAFTEARELNPGDPRVRVYLAEVYSRMGNRRGAANERSAARNSAMPGDLTRTEKELILIPGQ